MLKPNWKQSVSESVWVRKIFLAFSDILRSSDVWARIDTNTNKNTHIWWCCAVADKQRNFKSTHITDSESIHRVITIVAAAVMAIGAGSGVDNGCILTDINDETEMLYTRDV